MSALLDPVGPLPSDPAGAANEAEILHTIRRLPDVSVDELTALAWRRPAAAAQIIHELVRFKSHYERQVDQLRTDLLNRGRRPR